MMVSEIYGLLLLHQHAATTASACTCGAGSLEPMETGLAARAHMRHVAAVLADAELSPEDAFVADIAAGRIRVVDVQPAEGGYRITTEPVSS